MNTRSTQPDKFGWDDERISAYLDGELTSTEQTQFEIELSQNSELNQLVEELRIVRQQLEQLPQHKLESDFAANVLIRAAQEILDDSQSRSELQYSNHSINNGVIANHSDQKTTPASSSAAAQNSADASSRNVRPLIWSIVALAAGLLLLITNSKNPMTRNESVALNAGRDLPLDVDHKSFDKLDMKKGIEKQSDLAPDVTLEFLSKMPNSEKRREDFGTLGDGLADSAKAPTNPPLEGVTPMLKASPPTPKVQILARDGSERAANEALTQSIAKADSIPTPNFSGNPYTTSPVAQSAPIGKFSDIAMKNSDGLGGSRNDFDKSNATSNFAIQREAQSIDEMFVVQLSCEPTTIQNRSFEKLLRENQIAIVDEPKVSVDSISQTEPEYRAGNFYRKGGIAAPLMKAPATEKSEEQLAKKSFDSKSNEKSAVHDRKLERDSEIAQNSKDVEVVMIEMDRTQFDRLMSEVCNKTEEYASVQIAQAPLQSQFEVLNSLANTARFNAPSQTPANPLDNIAQNNENFKFAPNAKLGSEVLPGTNETNKSKEGSISGSIAQGSSEPAPVTPSLTQSVANQIPINQNASAQSATAQSANALNSSSNIYTDPASGGRGGSMSQVAPSSNGSIVNNQLSQQYPPTSVVQQNPISNSLNFPSNSQSKQSGAAQRLEFSEVDNSNIKAVTQNRYVGNSKPDAIRNFAPQQGFQSQVNSNVVGSPLNNANSSVPGAQPVQPLLKAPAPPASMSQSVTPQYETAPTNQIQPSSQSTNPYGGVVNEQKRIATTQQEKSDSIKSGEGIGRGSIANDKDSPSSVIGLDPTGAPNPQIAEDIHKKLGQKAEGAESEEKLGLNRGQTAKPLIKSESSEQFGQQSQQLNQQQAPLPKPSSNDYSPNQPQNVDQMRNKEVLSEQQLFAFQPQQQSISNLQANGRVRAVFILQKKPTQDVNPEPARNLSK